MELRRWTPACGFAPTGGFVVGGTGDGFGESDAVCGVRTDRPSPLVLWSTHELDAIRFRNACGWSGVHVVPGGRAEENSSWNRRVWTLFRRWGWQWLRSSRIDLSALPSIVGILTKSGDPNPDGGGPQLESPTALSQPCTMMETVGHLKPEQRHAAVHGGNDNRHQRTHAGVVTWPITVSLRHRRTTRKQNATRSRRKRIKTMLSVSRSRVGDVSRDEHRRQVLLCESHILHPVSRASGVKLTCPLNR